MTFMNDTDRQWEKFGKTDPYFGVVSHAKFHQSSITDAEKKDFFRSGHNYIENVFAKVAQHIRPITSIDRALDFGCGVGRLVIPLSSYSRHVTGVDVSDSMLKEARANCEERSIRNVTFVNSDDSLSALNHKFDFIHSYIVFQHIPVSRGERIFQNLLSLLADDGMGVLHFTYANSHSAIYKSLSSIKRHVPFAASLVNIIRGRKVLAPSMQMNIYDLNHLFFMIQRAGVSNCHIEFTDHGGHFGVVMYFQK